METLLWMPRAGRAPPGRPPLPSPGYRSRHSTFSFAPPPPPSVLLHLKSSSSSRSEQGIRRPSRRSVICASLFGVGAPEALVIGVVALLVFGPKGLAEVARNLGKTLRAFQPTIRELQDVSREFRSTLEREIGIDEVPPSTNYRPTTTNNQPPAVDPNVKPETAAYTCEELMKVTEEQLAASAATAWNPQPAAPSQESEATSTSGSSDAAPSGGNDGPAAAAATEPESMKANQSVKIATEPDSSKANEPMKTDARDKAA